MVFRDTDIISDPLNGLISISKFEKRLICTPEFQRLRRIKQLGFAHFVYPAAEYSRFTHSIGVCHQAKRIVDKINKNLETDRRYQKWRLYGRDIEKPTEHNVFITALERTIIAASGLLHDLPHGPFSHEIEGILIEDGENLIPDHDKVAENPALFLYLFDEAVSEIARLLRHFNQELFSALLPELQSVAPKANEDWRRSLAALLNKGALTESGMLKVGVAESPLQFSTKEKDPQLSKDQKFSELPFLAVAIFEVLLFEKQNEWLSPVESGMVLRNKKKQSKPGEPEEWGVKVKTDWTNDAEIRWQPIPGWFRAYRKDIIGNTICADLIDYVNRDGYHTGIVSTIDLKFLDRMTIVRAVLPPAGTDGDRKLKPPSNTINYEDIPISCEHVVFDIYDHKRGCIRQSVLTEILAYLQARYLLCERVYNHRVVEAARSMLQRIILILGSITVGNDKRRLLSVRDLHPLNKPGSADPLAPTGDEALLNWVRSIPTTLQEIYQQHSKEIDDAIELATLLQERRVFREAIIYDGLHGFQLPGKLGGAEVSCRALEAAFLTDPKIAVQLNRSLQDIDGVLREAFEQKTKGITNTYGRLQPRIRCLVGVRKWGKRYKPPLVLVSRPLKHPEAEHGSFDVEPLLDCEDPSNIKKQLDALKASYDSLWKVYLFLHPVFHARLFLDEHSKVEKYLHDFAAKYTGVRWQNAIAFKELLTEPLDNVLFLAQPEKAYLENYLVPTTHSKLLTEFTRVVTELFPDEASQFVDAVDASGFKTRITQELLKANTEDQLRTIVPKAVVFLKKFSNERMRKEGEASLAARELKVFWQTQVIKAIIDAREDGTRPQTEFGI